MPSYVLRRPNAQHLSAFRAACYAASLSPQDVLKDLIAQACPRYDTLLDAVVVSVELRYPPTSTPVHG